jgi:hypothetical protein
MSLYRKITYTKNNLLHKPDLPLHVATLDHCMVIDLPLEGIEQFVKDHLHWLPLKPDAGLL